MACDHNDNVEDLLTVAEVLDVFDKEDTAEINRQKTNHAKVTKTRDDFSKEYAERKAAVLKAKAAAHPAPKAKGKAKAKSAPKTRIPEGSPTQEQARALCPPGGYIWRGAIDGGSWQGHLPAVPAGWQVVAEVW